MNAMIMRIIVLKNKIPKALQLSAKCSKNKKHIQCFKASKIIENNFNIYFPKKQPSFNTILEIDKTWMREYIRYKC